jgi:hypothetical protein
MARDGYTCRLAFPGCEVVACEVHHTQPGIEADWSLVAACRHCHGIVTQQQAAAGRRQG